MREMTDSKNTIVGYIPATWTCQRVKMLVSGLTDGTHGTYERVKNGHLLLSAKNVFEDGLHIGDNESMISEEDYQSIVSNGFPQSGDVLLCCVGTIGRCTVYKEEYPYAFQRSVVFMRPNSKITSEMMKYAMQCDTTLAQETLLINQAAQAGLYQGAVKELYIPVPPLPEQRAIVSYLNSKCAAIDEAIERHKKIIEEIEIYRKSLITKSVTKGVYGDRTMKNCAECWGISIPDDWDYIKIKWVLDENHPYPLGDGDHGSIKADAYKESGIPFIRVQNLGWGTDIKTENIVYISEEQNETIRNSTLRPNDILFAKTGATVGKTAIIPADMPISNTTSHIGKITVSPEYNPRYVFYVLSSDVGYRQLWGFAEKKATRPEVAISEMKELRITLPQSRKEQDDIVSFLDEKIDRINTLVRGKQIIISKLEEYRKSIIYNAVTGKIDCRTEV